MAKMGEAEAFRIFEAVSQHAIDANVIGPDKRNGDQRALCVCEQGREREQAGKQIGVERVVDARGAAGRGEIAEQGEIGHDPERRKEPPACAGTGVERGREQCNGEAFEAQKNNDR